MYKIKARAGDWAEKEGKVELRVLGEREREKDEEGGGGRGGGGEWSRSSWPEETTSCKGSLLWGRW